MAYTAAGDGASWLPTGSLGATSGYASAPAATVAPDGTVIAAGSTAASKTSQQAVLLQASTAGQRLAVGSADGYPAIWRKTAAGSWVLVSTLSLVSAAPISPPPSGGTDQRDHGQAGWLAVGEPGPVAFTSANGTTWRPAGAITDDMAGVVAVAAAAGPHGYVIVGKQVAPGGSCVADVWWSPDLTRWTRARDVNDTAGSSVLQQITVQDDRVIALGTRTRDGVTTPLAELSTDDGATWRQVPAIR